MYIDSVSNTRQQIIKINHNTVFIADTHSIACVVLSTYSSLFIYSITPTITTIIITATKFYFKIYYNFVHCEKHTITTTTTTTTTTSATFMKNATNRPPLKMSKQFTHDIDFLSFYLFRRKMKEKKLSKLNQKLVEFKIKCDKNFWREILYTTYQ